MSQRLAPLLLLVFCTGWLTAASTLTCGGVYAVIDGNTVLLGNSLVERTWSRSAFKTIEMIDHRTGFTVGAAADFRLDRGPAVLASTDLSR
jgi:uncharacterized membrane protein YoaK (UPF0700 family)